MGISHPSMSVGYSAFRAAGALLCSFTLLAGTIQGQGPGAPKSDYSAESVVIEQFSQEFAFQADGTWTGETALSVRLQSEAALRAFGILPVPYRPDTQQLEIVYVRVKKRDGSLIETPAADAQDVSPEITRSAPTYSDVREKQIPVKGLSVGDLFEYKFRLTQFKPEIPNQFWYASYFFKGQVVLSETLKISVPSAKYVKVESPLYKPEVSEGENRKVYLWKTHQPEPTSPPLASGLPRTALAKATTSLPAVQLTTFRNWDEVGRWYAGLKRTQVTVTPALQAKADELTQGLTTK